MCVCLCMCKYGAFGVHQSGSEWALGDGAGGGGGVARPLSREGLFFFCFFVNSNVLCIPKTPNAPNTVIYRKTKKNKTFTRNGPRVAFGGWNQKRWRMLFWVDLVSTQSRPRSRLGFLVARPTMAGNGRLYMAGALLAGLGCLACSPARS